MGGVRGDSAYGSARLAALANSSDRSVSCGWRMCGLESLVLVSASFARGVSSPSRGGGVGRRGSCLAYEWEYLCSWRIICSRMVWSGLVVVVMAVVVSRRIFVESLELVAVEEDGGDER